MRRSLGRRRAMGVAEDCVTDPDTRPNGFEQPHDVAAAVGDEQVDERAEVLEEPDRTAERVTVRQESR